MSVETKCDICKNVIPEEDLYIHVSAGLHGLTEKEYDAMAWKQQQHHGDACLQCWGGIVHGLPAVLREVPTTRPVPEP